MTWILPVAALVIAMMSWLLAGRFTAPLGASERTASAVRDEGDLRTTLPGVDRRDEIGRLAGTLQGAFERLARAIEREQAFTRAAAHDLRSPLAAVRTRIHAVLAQARDAEGYKRALQEMDVDVERLSMFTNHLLLLARDPREAVLERVDLSIIVASAVERARRAAPDVDIDVRAPATRWIIADSLLAATVVQNLVDNAVRHGGGADVDVSLASRGPNTVVMEVRDLGPGVGADVLPRLGEPFFQEDRSRSRGGSGLGLSVVRRLVDIMRGSVDFGSEPGHGFVATVEWRKALAGPS